MSNTKKDFPFQSFDKKFKKDESAVETNSSLSYLEKIKSINQQSGFKTVDKESERPSFTSNLNRAKETERPSFTSNLSRAKETERPSFTSNLSRAKETERPSFTSNLNRSRETEKPSFTGNFSRNAEVSPPTSRSSVFNKNNETTNNVSPFSARQPLTQKTPHTQFKKNETNVLPGSMVTSGQNIFQRQTSSLEVPTAQSTQSVASIKDRLEALQKQQSNTAKLTKTSTLTKPKSIFEQNKGQTSPFARAEKAPVSMFKPFSKEVPTKQTSSLTTGDILNVQGINNSTIQISAAEFAQLRDFLYDEAGIYINENRKYLVENRLTSRLKALSLHNYGEYLNYLRYDNNKTTELNKFFENMTTNETSFFRNMPQLKIFKENVVEVLVNELKKSGKKKIHIWSAGCSSGEEPYTIAIILHEVLKNEINSWDIKITANDLSLAMLDLARKGVYSEYALRSTPPEIVTKYFNKQGRDYIIRPEVKKLVHFGQINFVNKPQMQAVEKSNVVFCRNVIIYFDDEMKTHVINCFYDNLLSGGYLIIGHSESLHNISRAFHPKHFKDAIIYQKKE